MFHLLHHSTRTRLCILGQYASYNGRGQTQSKALPHNFFPCLRRQLRLFSSSLGKTEVGKFLVEHLLIDSNDLGKLAKHIPTFFRADTEKNSRDASKDISGLRQIQQALETFADISPAEFGQMIAKNPSIKLLYASNRSSVLPCIEFFENAGVPPHQLKAILMKRPQVLLSRVDTLRDKLGFLCDTLSMPQADVLHFLAKDPVMLLLSKENVAASVATVRELLELGDLGGEEAARALRSALQQAPALLNLRPATLAEKRDFFRGEMGLSAAELRLVARRNATLLLLSVGGLRAKAALFRERLGLSREEFARGLLLNTGSILKLDFDRNLAPKIEFFAARFGLSEKQVLARMAANPRVFTNSLERRIRPRVEALAAAGVLPDLTAVGTLTRASEEDFEKWVAAAVQRKKQQEEGGEKI